jgi:hypothetical protein
MTCAKRLVAAHLGTASRFLRGAAGGRYRLTQQERREAKFAFQKQGRLTGAKWCFNEGADTHAR